MTKHVFCVKHKYLLKGGVIKIKVIDANFNRRSLIKSAAFGAMGLGLFGAVTIKPLKVLAQQPFQEDCEKSYEFFDSATGTQAFVIVPADKIRRQAESDNVIIEPYFSLIQSPTESDAGNLIELSQGGYINTLYSDPIPDAMVLTALMR